MFPAAVIAIRALLTVLSLDPTLPCRMAVYEGLYTSDIVATSTCVVGKFPDVGLIAPLNCTV